MRGKKGNRRSIGRKEVAKMAVEHLSDVIIENLPHNPEIADNAAKHLINVGKKHGIRADPKMRRLICRTCKQSLVPGKTSRVRINSGIITTSCIRCGRVQRKE